MQTTRLPLVSRAGRRVKPMSYRNKAINAGSVTNRKKQSGKKTKIKKTLNEVRQAFNYDDHHNTYIGNDYTGKV